MKIIKKLLIISAAAAFAHMGAFANNLPFAHDISIKNAGASGSLAPFINDSYSAYVNPAGLGWAKRQEISALYYNLFNGGLISSLSYSLPLLDAGAVAASLAYYSSGDIPGLDIHNQPSGSIISESYVNIAVSYGLSVLSIANAGVTIKYMSHTLAGSGSTAYGLDLGAAAELPANLRLSLFLENAVKPGFWLSGGKSETMPLYFDATLSYSRAMSLEMKDSLKLGAGIDAEEYKKAAGWHTGAEYSVYDGLAAIRVGIRESGFSAGASLSYMDASLDYAYVGTAYDFIHRFSVSYCIGQDIRALEQELKTKEDRLKYELVNKIREESLIELKSSVTNSLISGDSEAALASVQRALVWSPNDSWFKGKETEIRESINKDKKDRLLLEADRLMTENSYIDALVSLKNALELDPQNAAIKTKFETASKHVKTTSEKNLFSESLNKEKIKQYFDSGLDLYASGEYEKAVKEWENVIKASPLQSQVHDLILKAKAKVKRIEDQEKNIEILKKQKISALYNDAVVLHTRGKFEESINIWKEILILEPGNTEAKEYLQKVTEEYKKIQRQNLEW